MSMLPDELWGRIMEIGIETKTLDHKSLCCLSVSCRRFYCLAADDSLWASLLLSDFPSCKADLKSCNYDSIKIRDGNYTSSSTANGTFKSLYQTRHVKDREKKRLAHKRVVLRIESEIAERLRKIQEIKLHSSEEKEKMNKVVADLLNLRRIRQASVALNVWQPEIIRGRQRQMVQQSNVPVEFRVNALEMELSLCKQQITGLNKALQVEKRRLRAAKEELASVRYHPLQDSGSTSYQPNDCRTTAKKFKYTSN